MSRPLILPYVVADENIPGELVCELQNLGHKVYWIAREKKGISDREVWSIAAGRRAILLTRDDRFLPQLDKDEILNGPQVVVFVANGIENNELQAGEFMTALMSWYFRNLSSKDWHHVSVKVEGNKRTRNQCWGEENRRRN
jgi:predicted nuclease of predicted toxin-antitoxin system